MKEALRYFNNAKEILAKAPIEDNRYIDVKYVQEACGTAYLAILKEIDEYLLEKGLSKKEIPRSADAYRKALRKYPAIHDGKLLVDIVKDALKAARAFIEKIK